MMASKHASGHQSSNHTGGHPAMDYAEHNRTYAGFIKGTVGLIVACVLILVGMAVFLV
jgi:Bacterial aa3 type cytochrome c oxidase subunit IV